MLPKKYRITLPDFNKIKQRGEKFPSSILAFFIKKSTSPFPRFVAIISKSLDKRSSYRNRTRRIITEAVRRQLGTFSTQAAVLIKAKKILKKEDRLSVENEIKKIAEKI